MALWLCWWALGLPLRWPKYQGQTRPGHALRPSASLDFPQLAQWLAESTRQDASNKAVQIFVFSLTAQFAPPGLTGVSTTSAAPNTNSNSNPTTVGAPPAPPKRSTGNL